MNLLLDMNLSPVWVSYLSEAGFSSVHWSTIGEANAPDAQIMAYAQANNFIVMTHDLDFTAILAATNLSKPSVIQIRSESLSIKDIGPIVIRALLQTRAELQTGALISVDTMRTRVRILPLNP